MQRYIVIGALIVIALLVIYYRAYVRYFFRLLMGEIKHNNNVNKLMKQNIKKRWLKSKDIKKYVEYAKNNLNKKQYSVKKEYVLSQEIERRLKYSRYDDKAVEELLKDIFKYLELDYSAITFNIRRTSSRSRTCIAGSYNIYSKSITLEISTYSTLEQIVAILAHESTHHLLYENKIVLKENYKNEILTDITAIYLGFGKYFYKAYKDERRIVFDGEYHEIIDGDKLGYIGYGDAKYTHKCCKKIKKLSIEK